MDYEFGEEADLLRTRLRWLAAEHLPADFLGGFTHRERDQEVVRNFVSVLADEGLLTLAWPEEYGGGGGSVWEQTVVREEMWAHHEPRGAQYMGLNWVGPAIMRFGTPEQKERFLPRIARGTIVWCQGFSEPDAGSDLASLRTAAKPDGDGWLISGQKVWTSYATMADYCVLAARTAPDGPGHRGITLFLLPMSRDGIEVRPIDAMVGPHHLNEVFLNDVWAGPDDVLGSVDEGWAVMREALAFERIGIARYARCDRLLDMVHADLDRDITKLPAGLQSRFVQALVKTRIARLLAYRALHKMESGDVLGAIVSIARIAVTINDQETADVLAEAVGARWLAGRATVADDHLAAAVDDHWRYSRTSTVASGTLEMQKILVSRSLWGS